MSVNACHAPCPHCLLYHSLHQMHQLSPTQQYLPMNAALRISCYWGNLMALINWLLVQLQELLSPWHVHPLSSEASWRYIKKKWGLFLGGEPNTQLCPVVIDCSNLICNECAENFIVMHVRLYKNYIRHCCRSNSWGEVKGHWATNVQVKFADHSQKAENFNQV